MVIKCIYHILYVQTVTRQCFCFPNSQWGTTAHDTILVCKLTKSKKQPYAGHMTSTWPRLLLRKSHHEKLKSSHLMVKCIFDTSVTGANLSLSRSIVNQVKVIYCPGSQLTPKGIVLASLETSRAEISSAN